MTKANSMYYSSNSNYSKRTHLVSCFKANYFDHFLFPLNDYKGTIRFPYRGKNILAQIELLLLVSLKRKTLTFPPQHLFEYSTISMTVSASCTYLATYFHHFLVMVPIYRSIQKVSSHVIWKIDTFIEEDTRNTVHRTMMPQSSSKYRIFRTIRRTPKFGRKMGMHLTVCSLPDLLQDFCFTGCY